MNNLISYLNKNGMLCCPNRKTRQFKIEINKLKNEIVKLEMEASQIKDGY